MKATGIFALVIVCLAIICVITGIAINNAQITNKNNVEKAAGDIDADLTRRFDLIPNLVSATQGYMKFEKELFTQVADLRSRIGQTKLSLTNANADPKLLAQFMTNQDQLSGVLSKLVIAVEKYPELKSDKTITQLMDELAGTENRINVSRKRYNEAVTTLNNSLEKFPGSFIASYSRVQKRQRFEATETARTTVPKVDLSL